MLSGTLPLTTYWHHADGVSIADFPRQVLPFFIDSIGTVKLIAPLSSKSLAHFKWKIRSVVQLVSKRREFSLPSEAVTSMLPGVSMQIREGRGVRGSWQGLKRCVIAGYRWCRNPWELLREEIPACYCVHELRRWHEEKLPDRQRYPSLHFLPLGGPNRWRRIWKSRTFVAESRQVESTHRRTNWSLALWT